MFTRVLGFFTQRWLLTLLGLLALALLLWFAGPLIAVADHKPLASRWVRGSVIALLPLVWLLLRFRVRLTDRRAEDRLSRELVKDPADGRSARAAEAAPDPEQAVLAERLKTAFQTLERAKLAKGQRLYQLPWYVIIGAPGSGKTTALKRSGLHFPLQSQLGDEPVQGAGGTRYCDWWFTDEAVFIDTAGRYTTQDNPQEGAGRSWLGFLDMLRRCRPKRPLNGVLVTISILDLLQKTPTQQAMQATAIKRRVQELNGHLGMELPVYVLFTKCDLIAGFNEFFLDLEAEDREQVWGVTLPLPTADDPAVPLSAFPARYEELIASAADRVPHRLNDERSPRRRSLAFEFPRQMRGLQQALHGFLRDVFVPNQFEQPAILRGVYFVSGTQTAAPASWAGGVLPPSLCAAPVSSASTTAAKSFFITQLLRQVIVAEAGLAAANRRVQRRFRWAYGGALAAVGGLFLASSMAWLISHGANRDYLAALATQVSEYRLRQEERAGAAADWWLLAQTLDQLQALPTGYRDGGGGRPLRMGFGLYQGDKIGSQARNSYLQVLERKFMPALVDQLLQQLDAAGEREEFLYEALRVYLMFYHPERMDREAVQIWLAISWDRLLPGVDHEATRGSLREHLRVALAEDLLPPPQDERRVAAARAILLETPLERRLYLRLKNQYLAEQPHDFNLVDVLGRRDAEALFTRRSGKPLTEGVPSFYTYRGFHRGFNPQQRRLASYLTQERWVYGGGSDELTEDELAELSRQLEGYYFGEYIAHWNAYLGDLALRSFQSADGGRQLARELAAAEAPVVKLLQAVRQHTALSDLPAAAGAAAQVAGAVSETALASERRRLERLVPDDLGPGRIRLPGHQVDAAFQPLNRFVGADDGAALERLQGSLGELSAYFDNLLESDDQRRAAFVVSVNPAQNAAALRELQAALAPAPAAVRQWFGSLAGDSQRITAVAARSYINDAWRSDVLGFYQRAIVGRYPLVADAAQEIRMEDFIKFFGPNGILDEFFSSYLAPFVDTGRGQWRWRRNVGLSNQTLRLFQSAQRIQEAYFVGPGQPRADFTVRPQALDQTVVRSLLETGNSHIIYQHGPVRATPVQWKPEEGDRSRLVLNLASRGTPLSTSEDGPWGLFRLLERHAVSEPLAGGHGLLVTFEVQGVKAQYELRPQRAVNPFSNQEIRSFALPRSL